MNSEKGEEWNEDELHSVHQLQAIFNPQSVAVIGASLNPWKPGSLLVKLLREMGFGGKIAPINPAGNGKELHGEKFYGSVKEVPYPVDVAAVIISPPDVPGVVADCLEKGVKGVIINSEGFAESGEEGAKYQRQIEEMARTKKMRIFGPNTTGIIDTQSRLTTSYFVDQSMMKPGSLSFVAQSGIFAGALLKHLGSLPHMGIRKAIGLGNKVDVDEADALNFLSVDEGTKVVAMYLEGIKRGHAFLRAARRATREKPVVVLKGGRTEEGARASASHTASLAVNDCVFRGAIAQGGLVEVETIQELVETLKAFHFLPALKGKRLGVITFSGAQGILAIDACDRHGMERARFSTTTQERLMTALTHRSKARNPVDVYPDALHYGYDKIYLFVLEVLQEDPNVDAVLLVAGALANAEFFSPLIEMVRAKVTKPLVVSLLGPRPDMEASRKLFDEHKIWTAPDPDLAVKILSKMYRYHCWKDSQIGP